MSETSRATLRDSWWLALAALLVRLPLVVWAASRFPPAADGTFYQVVASRIARGLGYTWAWPDGAVTYAAHYPVGYPAILGGLYALFGPSPIWAMWLNALAGTVIVFCVHRLLARETSRRAALLAALAAALHPTLLAYTPAMMTELVSASLLVAGAAVAVSGSRRRTLSGRLGMLLALGLLMGLAVLVRPQQIVFAPLFGALLLLAQRPRFAWWPALVGAVVATGLAVACCAPWTLRNCNRMERCVFVSANGGWNLFIGTSPLGEGAWVALDRIGVPPACRTVFKEAEKDRCFGEDAKRRIAAAPLAWASLAPKKLRKTFDDVGAPGYYLNVSNGSVFGNHAKWLLGASEVLALRLGYLALAWALARTRGPRQRMRQGLALAAALSQLFPLAWLGALLLVLAVLSLGRQLQREVPLLLAGSGLAATAVIHAVFFGGARYAMVVLPLVLVGAGVSGRLRPTSDRGF